RHPKRPALWRRTAVPPTAQGCGWCPRSRPPTAVRPASPAAAHFAASCGSLSANRISQIHPQPPFSPAARFCFSSSSGKGDLPEWFSIQGDPPSLLHSVISWWVNRLLTTHCLQLGLRLDAYAAPDCLPILEENQCGDT